MWCSLIYYLLDFIYENAAVKLYQKGIKQSLCLKMTFLIFSLFSEICKSRRPRTVEKDQKLIRKISRNLISKFKIVVNIMNLLNDIFFKKFQYH